LTPVPAYHAKRRRHGIPDPGGSGAPPHVSEAGFSLMEVMVALAVLGVVMSALGAFSVTTLSVINAQSNAQTATQLVNSSLERVRGLRGSSVTSGRDQASTVAQWAAASAAVIPYLGTMAQAYDDTATAGSTAALPIATQTVSVNGVPYSQSWYVGQCWQPVIGGACLATMTPGSVAFYRVLAVVGWAGRRCPAAGCDQIASTLVSGASTEPVFRAHQTAVAPQVINPGRQNGELTIAVNLTVTATGGAPPLTWAASGLPAGLSMNSSGKVTGTPTTAGTYSVSVTAIDGFNLIGSAAFTWFVTTLPVLTKPANQASQGGVAVTAFTPTLTGGTSPLTWKATGLPSGLSIDASTGAVTGIPTTAGGYPVSVTVTDAYAKASTTSFTWTIPALTITTPALQRGEVGIAATALQAVASGGIKPYTWATTNAPPGLSISTTGLVSGAPTTAGNYAARIKVVDTGGKTASTAAFTWAIIAAPRISSPRTAQTGALAAATSIQAVATGGTGVNTWSVANLPTGTSMTTAGKITGAYTAAGRYLTTLTLTDSAGATDAVTLIWTVTSGTALRITSPTGDRADALGQAMTSLTALSAGGTGTKVWTATGLPTGVSIATSTGTVSGTPTAAGIYTSKITVTDGANATSNFMFFWTIV
jgi:prepilin-type N-terminal cleavage/methylation domain-containing protein